MLWIGVAALARGLALGREGEADPLCQLTLCVWLCAGEVGAAHLLLPLWNIPVQQCERERRETHSGTDLLRLVFAAGSKQSLQKPALLLPIGICMYPNPFLWESPGGSPKQHPTKGVPLRNTPAMGHGDLGFNHA